MFQRFLESYIQVCNNIITEAANSVLMFEAGEQAAFEIGTNKIDDISKEFEKIVYRSNRDRRAKVAFADWVDCPIEQGTVQHMVVTNTLDYSPDQLPIVGSMRWVLGKVNESTVDIANIVFDVPDKCLQQTPKMWAGMLPEKYYAAVFTPAYCESDDDGVYFYRKIVFKGIVLMNGASPGKKKKSALNARMRSSPSLKQHGRMFTNCMAYRLLPFFLCICI